MNGRTQAIPTTRRDPSLKRKVNRAWIPLLPVLLLFAVQFVLPLVIVAVTGFQRSSAPGRIEAVFTLENFTKILSDQHYLDMLGRSFSLAIGTAIAAALLGYPLAWGLARGPRWLKTMLLVLIMIPLMTSSVIRSFGWMVLFKEGSLYSTIFGAFADESTGLMYTLPGLIIAMAHVLLPFMVLTLYGVIDKLDPTLENASLNMGASRIGTFFRITFPLTMNGVIAGMLLVFATAISSFVTPKLIGGTQMRVLATEIYEQAIILLNWPLAAAMALTLMLVALGTAAIYSTVTNRLSATR